MVTQAENDLQSQAPPPGWLFDDIKDLYIGHIDELIGYTMDTHGKTIKTHFGGEVLLHGQAGDDTFKITSLQRLALHGEPDPNREGPDELGVISLAGPTTSTDPRGQDGKVSIENLRLHLHYRALSRLRPRSRTRDSVAPQVETIAAKLALTWEKDGKPGEPEIRLKVELHIADLVEGRLGIVKEIQFEPFMLVFRKAGSGSSGETPKYNLLAPGRGRNPPYDPCNLASYNQLLRPVRQLPLKFINVSSSALGALQQPCKTQLRGATEVWGNKAALRLNVDLVANNITHDMDIVIDDAPTLKGKYQSVNTEKQETLPCDYAHVLHPPANPNPANPCYDPPTDPYANQVEIYLVDSLEGCYGGGCTKNDSQALAYCILQVDQLANPYLLAHELGHVLGLSHPRSGHCPGSSKSIMAPHLPTNYRENTRQNCQIFGYDVSGCNCPGCAVQLNPLCTATTDEACFRVDW